MIIGFGILLTAAANFLVLRLYPLDILGFMLAYIAAGKLKDSEPSFTRVGKRSGIMFIYAAIYGVLWATTFFGTTYPLSWRACENMVYAMLLVWFYGAVYDAVSAIGKESRLEKAVSRARSARSMSYVSFAAHLLYAGGAIATLLVPKAYEVPLLIAANGITMASLLADTVWHILNIRMIHICYRNIVTDDMLQKETVRMQRFERTFGRSKK